MKNEKIKKIITYTLSFCIPILFIMVYFILNKLTFADFYISDLKEQYLYMFDYYKGILSGDNSLFYSFSKGIGGSMYGTYFYYLSSPLNLLLIFFPSNNIYIGIILLILLKIGLSGLTMNIYLNNSNNNKKIINLIFSCCYSMMSFNLVYYFNIMWLDVIYLAPLILLELDKIIDNKKSFKYIILLFLSIFSNWYISYMLCIFLIIYIFYKLYIKYDIKKDKKVIKKIILKFICSSLFAGLLCSFIFIPLLNEISNFTRLADNNKISLLSNLAESLTKFGITSSTITSNFKTPNLFCSILINILLINYFIYQKKSKEKVATIAVFIFFALSLFLPFLSNFWHGGSPPIVFNYRWVFLINLFLIILVSSKFDILLQINNKKRNLIIFIYILLITTGYFVLYILNKTPINYFIILINLFFVFSYLFFMNLLFIKKHKSRIWLFIFFLLEIIVFFKLNFLTQLSLKETEKDYSFIQRNSIVDEISNLEKDYYRVGGRNLYSLDETLNSKIGRISSFVSTTNDKGYEFLKKTGYLVYYNENYDNNNQDVINTLLGIKYWYGVNESQHYEKTNKSKTVNIYKNNKALSIGYMIENNFEESFTENVFYNQNLFTRKISNISVFDLIDLKKLLDKSYLCQINDSDYLYFYVNDDNINIIINGKTVYNNFQINSSVFKIKNVWKNEQINLKITDSNNNDLEFSLATINNNNYNLLLNSINEQMKNIIIDGNKLNATINVESNKKTLLLTIPYEKGWTIYIDNKKTNYYQISNAFIGIDLDKGYHIISMEYLPYKLNEGIAVSIFILLISIIYVKRK